MFNIKADYTNSRSNINGKNMEGIYKRKKSRCNVDNCNRDVNTSMHHAPKSNSELRNNWMKVLKLNPLYEGDVYVCGNHFKKSDFTQYRDNRVNVRLRRNVVPSINIPNENSMRISETTTADINHLIKPTNDSFFSDEKWKLQENLKTMDMLVDIPNSRMPGAAFVNREVIYKCTLPSNEDFRPQKSGEIFRDIAGKFSFMCTFCNIVCDNCNEIMDHINSHFDQKNSFTFEPIEEASPEFISVDELEPETTNLETKIIANDIFPTNTIGQPILNNAPTTLKLKIETPNPGEYETNVRSEMKVTSDKSKIVRIVKLTPIKFRPHKVYGSQKTRVLNKVNPINCLIKRTDNPTEIKFNCTQSEPEEDVVASLATYESDLRASKENHSINYAENERPVYVRQSHSKCYQCDMEAKIKDPSIPKRHICVFCTTWFPNHVELEIHCKQLHNKDANYIKSNNFYCCVCQKKFTRRDRLASHLKVHYSNRAHLCSICGLKFNTTMRLEKHMKVHGEATLECYECGKKFKLFERLRSHFWVHNKELSFACKICSKAFKSKRYLRSHMVLHNEVKINCRYCDAIFNFKSVRRIHEKSHHNVL